MLLAKLGEVDERIEAMKKFRGTLADHLAACERELRLRGKGARCPVLVEIKLVGHPQRTVERKVMAIAPITARVINTMFCTSLFIIPRLLISTITC